MFCAGNKTATACFGDEGGPAISGDEQVGIVSNVQACSSTLFTNLGDEDIKDFINTNQGDSRL